MAIAGNAMDELEADTTIEPLLGPDEGPKRPAVLFDNLKVLEMYGQKLVMMDFNTSHLYRICFGKFTLTMGNPFKNH